MNYWYAFWMVDFAVASIAFIVILIVVAIRGFADLRRMLSDLRS